VRHPHIVQLYEVMATKLRIYFVMEYVRGGELFARVAQGRLKEDDARRYFQQLASAVAFCHARGVYHRNIKPQNLLLDDAGDLKVSSFRLSAVAQKIRHDGLFHTFCGTLAYVAPEVLSRRGYDAGKAYLWSCGVVLYVLVTGYLPFQHRNLVGMHRKIHKGDFRCPKWFCPELTRLLRRVLDTNAQRHATADDVMDDEWFKVGFRCFSFRIEDDRSFTCCFELDEDGSIDDAASTASPPDLDTPRTGGLATRASSPSLRSLEARSNGLGGSSRRRSSLNAFDIISFSRGFDLSGLFEDNEVVEQDTHHPLATRFVSAAPAEKILETLERAATAAGMVAREMDDGSISMEGTREGEQGALAVAAEIYELTTELLMVEHYRKWRFFHERNYFRWFILSIENN
jgi:serine/threonine protein kinase